MCDNSLWLKYTISMVVYNLVEVHLFYFIIMRKHVLCYDCPLIQKFYSDPYKIYIPTLNSVST